MNLNKVGAIQGRIQNSLLEGGPFPRGEGAPTCDFVKCSQKLYEIEKILFHGGAPPLDPPLQYNGMMFAVESSSTSSNLTTLYDMLTRMLQQLKTVTGNLETVTKELEETKNKLNTAEES